MGGKAKDRRRGSSVELVQRHRRFENMGYKEASYFYYTFFTFYDVKLKFNNGIYFVLIIQENNFINTL